MRRRSFLAVLGALVVLLPSLAQAAPVFDAVSIGTGVLSTSITFSHTLGAGSDRVLVCGASSGGNGVGTSSATYDGDAMTEISDTAGAASFIHMSVFIIKESGGLATGAANVVITFGSSTRINAGCMSFTGVDQTTPQDGLAVTSVSTSNPTNTIVSATGDMVVDFVSCVSGSVTSATADAGQTERIDSFYAADVNLLLASHEAGATAVIMSWTPNVSCGYNSTAFNLNASAGGGGGTIQTGPVYLPLLGVGAR